MRKIFLSFFMLFAVISTVFAQKLTVESFKLASNDLTAQSQPRKDLNNLNCALVKVGIALDGVKFDGSIMGEPIHKLGEYWVYMPKGVSMLQVLHKNYTPLMVNFYDYGVGKVESGMTYILTLSKPAGSTEPTDAGGNFYALTVTPKMLSSPSTAIRRRYPPTVNILPCFLMAVILIRWRQEVISPRVDHSLSAAATRLPSMSALSLLWLQSLSLAPHLPCRYISTRNPLVWLLGQEV